MSDLDRALARLGQSKRVLVQQTVSLETPGALGMAESMDERIAREKREKYEASDEYKQLQADKARDAANIALASGSQLSEADIDAESAKSQGDSIEQARKWIADVTGMPVEGDLGEALKSGVLLCEVVNKVKPGTIQKISKSAMPFPQRENIKAWTDAARDVFGVPDRDNFETGDLFEQSNMKQVVICILSAGRASGSVPGYSGPTITTAGSVRCPATIPGPLLSTSHPGRCFTGT